MERNMGTASTKPSHILMTPGQAAHIAGFGPPLSGAMPSDVWEVNFDDDARDAWERKARHAIRQFNAGCPGGVTPGQVMFDSGAAVRGRAWIELPQSHRDHYERIAQAAIDCVSCPSVSEHPMQPVIKAKDGVHRFKENAIVEYLRNVAAMKLGDDINKLSLMPWSQEDWEQFMQLTGYSVSGYCELSMVSNESKDAAHAASEKLL